MSRAVHQRPWLLALALTCACTPGGCPPGGGDGGLPDGGLPDGGLPDGTVEAGVDSGSLDAAMDASVDSGADASVDSGSFDAAMDASVDSGADASVDSGADAAPDAAICDPAMCASSGECVMATCVDDACTESPRPDGTDCGELVMGLPVGACVAGTCLTRSCGDGYRETGSSLPREGCDDGNLIDGDGCSSLCVPEEVVVDSDPDPVGMYTAHPTAQHPAAAADGEGRILLCWTREGDINELMARRYDARGAPLPGVEGEPFVFAPMQLNPSVADPTVAGLRGGGWVLAWTDRNAAASYRLVRPDGTLGAAHRASTDLRHDKNTRVAPVGDGFVMVWEYQFSTLADPEAGLMARVFDAGGIATSDPFFVATSRGGREREPALASDGDEWLVVYSQVLTSMLGDRLYARRFRGTTPVDAMEFSVTMQPGTSPVATSLGGGVYALAWHSQWLDGFGDVYTRLVGPGVPSETSATESPLEDVLGTPALYPSIAALGPTSYLVAWEQDDGLPHGVFVAVGDAMLPPEATDLDALLRPYADSLSLASTPAGTFFAWETFAEVSPLNAIHTYLLPPE